MIPSSPIYRLLSYVTALRPIIYIRHFDGNEVDRLLMDPAVQRAFRNSDIQEFQYGKGPVDFRSKAKRPTPCELPEYLASLDTDVAKRSFVVLKDIHHGLDDPRVIASLKSMAYKKERDFTKFNRTFIIVSPVLRIPEELKHLVNVLELPLPEQDEIVEMIDVFAEAQGITVSEEAKGELAISLRGLSRFHIDQVLKLAYQEGGELGDKQSPWVLQEKEQLIRKSGLLEVIKTGEGLDELGGLELFKEWIRRKSAIYKQLDRALAFGVVAPKGVMIIGMPGCGKSLAAKATASLFELPLLRLDVGKLLGRYIGESEENMRRTLEIVEAVSPCVLWIDEVEKAFSGLGDSLNPTVTRLFGQFLTWMQETPSNVFIVATANDITTLPPEFLRKGRFDELFFVGFPSATERKQILELHLTKRKQSARSLDLMNVVNATVDFSGADLEAIVNEAVELAFLDNPSRGVTPENLLMAQKRIKSLATSQKDKIEKLKAKMKELDVQPASKE